MATPSVPFAYPEDDDTKDGASELRADILRRVGSFIAERVIKEQGGRLPSAQTIAVRLIVLNALLYPDQLKSLNHYARQLGCTRAWLSKVGIQFSASIGMRASWQRINATKIYAERARGVHAGTWVATSENGKWERRKAREAKRRKK
jgi:hypothetical protein